MDPLSIISAVAGIATAGTALVSSLYTLVETVRNAPRQMRDVAKEMTSLTCVLEFLVEIISDGHKIATRHYLNGIKSVVKSIENTQNEIMDMIDDHSIINRLKWRKAKTLLEDIRAHQSTVSMQVAILNLGMLAKRDGHIKKASERRLRKQAESLVQASNACLEANREDTLHFVPPPPRPASPPVYGAAPGAEWYYGAPSPPRNSDSIGVEPSIPDYSGIPKVPLPDRVATSDNIKEQENKPPDAPRPPIIPGRSDSLPALPNTPQPGKSGSSADEATRKHTLMTYTHNSPGDAATLLYNLVFSSSGGDSGYESDQADPAPSDTHETEETWFSEDYDSSDGDVGDTIRRESRMASKRADRERRKGEENAAAGSSHPSGRKGQNLNGHNQPSMVVNRLLLKWTSLTNQEVEDTDSGVEDYAENDRLRSIRGTVAAIAARNNESGNNARTTVPESSFEYGSDSRDRVPPYAPYGEHGYTGYPQPWSYRPSPSINVPNGSARPPPPPTSHDTTGYDFYGNRNPYISPFMPNTGQNMQSNTQYPGYVTHNLAETKAPYSFKPPNVLILDRKSEIDEARDSSSVDNLAVRNKGFRVERQSSAEMIYHPASFLSMHGLEGEGILGALAASRSNAMYSELWLTLKHGFDLQIPYSRSSDVGETWFLGERPVFILFYHSSYQPQFFPLSKDDKIAFDRECVTIGEQWITDEALKQHGIVPRGKENGKLILDPDISTVFVVPAGI
ncbi:hypothetical protein BKA67DRAFT_101014 [Truncatella angustata]|uniref:Azaphilone pigments biosynthesis cluster protein L N-terminal domain-containing protein n=1 Tax=Truncatella angustata TaxID=152316 RepID=A0A9P8UC81_9PEZI|nr:uncharacterized protein BKA67DRAFT_101014 [Truncatella angustata]KAH6646386.1 hypothetical protein BKA67DRAFT_101014 [Truncatella angustata]